MSFNDSVECVIDQCIRAMKQVFDPASSYPPLGGGSTDVRFFACDATPMSAVDIHMADTATADDECGTDPFLWVRFMRRYRSQVFPQLYIGPNGCAAQRVVTLEFGVARCAVIGEDGNPPTWDQLAQEAEVGLDDSGRIELAMCIASKGMTQQKCSTEQGQDAVVPYGPEGAVVGWLGTLYAAID